MARIFTEEHRKKLQQGQKRRWQKQRAVGIEVTINRLIENEKVDLTKEQLVDIVPLVIEEYNKIK